MYMSMYSVMLLANIRTRKKSLHKPHRPPIIAYIIRQVGLKVMTITHKANNTPECVASRPVFSDVATSLPDFSNGPLREQLRNRWEGTFGSGLLWPCRLRVGQMGRFRQWIYRRKIFFLSKPHTEDEFLHSFSAPYKPCAPIPAAAGSQYGTGCIVCRCLLWDCSPQVGNVFYSGRRRAGRRILDLRVATMNNSR